MLSSPSWTAHASLAGLASTVAALSPRRLRHTRFYLPVGVQIIGPRFEDDTAITFAELLAEVTGGFRPPLEHAPGQPADAGAAPSISASVWPSASCRSKPSQRSGRSQAVGSPCRPGDARAAPGMSAVAGSLAQGDDASSVEPG